MLKFENKFWTTEIKRNLWHFYNLVVYQVEVRPHHHSFIEYLKNKILKKYRTQLTPEQHRCELCGSTFTKIFSNKHQKTFSLLYDFNIFFLYLSLCKNVVCNICNIQNCVNWLFMLSVRILEGQEWAISSLGGVKSCTDFQPCEGPVRLSPVLFKGQLYCKINDL